MQFIDENGTEITHGKHQIDKNTLISDERTFSSHISLPPRFCACILECVLSAVIGFPCSCSDDGLLMLNGWLSAMKTQKMDKNSQ